MTPRSTQPGHPGRSSRALRLRRRRTKNPEGTMSIVEHLQELRRRVIISLVAVGIGAVIGYIWYAHSAFGIPSLGDILLDPYCHLPQEKRLYTGPDGDCRLLATAPFEMLMLRIKMGTLFGAILASPVWLYQIWAYITPGLRRNERSTTLTVVSTAVALFVLGVVLAYFILSVGLEFLLTIGQQTQVAAVTGGEYFGIVLKVLVIFGVSFEVPLLVVVLNRLGLLRYETINGNRAYVAVALYIFAAVMTPGQDPYSMLVLGTALVALVELAFQLCRLHDRSVERERPDWLNVDDDHAAPLDQPSGTPGAASPLGPADPIAAPSAEGIARPYNPQADGGWNDSSAGGAGADYSDVL